MLKDESDQSRVSRLITAAFAALTVLAALLPAASIAQPAENDRCQRCHGESWIAALRPQGLAAMVRPSADGTRTERAQADIHKLYTPNESWLASAHGTMSCDQCHTGIDSLPHAQVIESLSCADCHSTEAHDQGMGSHSATNPNAPSCTDCHGDSHAVAPVNGHRTHAGALAMVDKCSTCHSDVGEGRFSPGGTFHDSIHGESLFKKGLAQGPMCSDCHGTHRVLPVSDPASPMSKLNAAGTCGACHEGVVDIFMDSVHGQHLADGDENAATCTSCHHSHGIERVGPDFLTDVVAECSHCHIDLGKSYLLSYHGKASQLGSHDVAVCSSCHGAHDILPASDPHSRIAPENLKATCAECHPAANDNFVKYIAHVDYSSPEAHPAVYYTFWGMTILLCSVLAVFIPHSLLWFQRTLADRIKAPPHHGPKPRMIRRFNRVHRITHGLIMISFLGLVATGFPLKYSYADWAQNLTSAFGGIHAMGILHRIFAVITFAYAGLHFAYLVYFFIWKCPAPRMKYIFGPESMVFSLKDFKDFIAMVKWFFRLGPRPRFDRWTYFEKFDYWGEIWGVFLIGGSGLLLWMPELFSRWLPGWVLNCAMVIHSIEALLAASVIFLVHFFNTHLRPEKFPIDMTMWSGQISEEEMKEERPAEYERLVATGALDASVVPPITMTKRIVGIVLGMSAFLFGIFLIILAIRTEILNITGLH